MEQIGEIVKRLKESMDEVDELNSKISEMEMAYESQEKFYLERIEELETDYIEADDKLTLSEKRVEEREAFIAKVNERKEIFQNKCEELEDEIERLSESKVIEKVIDNTDKFSEKKIKELKKENRERRANIKDMYNRSKLIREIAEDISYRLDSFSDFVEFSNNSRDSIIKARNEIGDLAITKGATIDEIEAIILKNGGGSKGAFFSDGKFISDVDDSVHSFLIINKEEKKHGENLSEEKSRAKLLELCTKSVDELKVLESKGEKYVGK